jgi:hypothetical protein
MPGEIALFDDPASRILQLEEASRRLLLLRKASVIRYAIL